MRRPYSSFAVPALVLGTLAVVDVPAHAAAGGPDAAGYTFVDEVDGATFNYVDITLTGTLLVDADDGTASIALGAPFTFYGIVYLGMGVSTNGFISDDLTLASDFSNDCPLPDPPSLGAGSFRMAALHDDLVTQVFYQYFDAAQAAAVGYPGEADGISVFQWVGGHFGGQQSAVDAELVLRHADNSIVSMVAQDSDAGSGSTMGIQNMDGSIGLTYGCNQPGYVVPGTTAVEYTPGVLPDSDCCNPSGTATPGCTNVACQVTVCAADASCCDTAWTQACADAAALDCGFLCGGPLPNINLNEIRINDLGPDNNEYFEIVGVPGTSLDDVQYIVIGDFPTGEIEAVVDLSGNVVPPSAFFSVGEASLTLGVPDLVAPLNFENNDTVTHMLVGGFSGAVGNNVDPNADGVFDTTPWLVIFDALSIVEPGGEELPYATAANCGGGGECQEVGGNTTPSHVYRCPNISGAWNVGNADENALPLLDTPGDFNACFTCGDGVLEVGEDCDDAGESAACNVDCTLTACGDGVVNMTAGEVCDDAGESAGCNADCSVASCGDGQINASAAEECDDAGESAQCDVDCSLPECGDGVFNPSSGEECDDLGESARCDVDCTAAVCGDGIINTTAGETCDDVGRSAECDMDCTAVSCGDGVLNVSAGEQCDGDGVGTPGPTADCDDDCTAAMCGDGLTNALAGEDCDDAGESAVCDIDCTAAECGDGVVNRAAAEQCDDGNLDPDDGCAPDCVVEDDVGTTTDTGADSTAGEETSTSPGSEGGVASTGGPPVPGDTTTGSSSGGVGLDGGVFIPDDGCGCTGGGRPLPSGALWLLGLVGLGRRRRRATATRGSRSARH